MLRKVFIGLSAMFLMQNSYGQKAGFSAVGVNTYPGFLVAHRDDSQNLEAHTWAVELSLIRKKINSVWADAYRRPEVSLGFMYMDLGQHQLTGRAFAILPSFTTTIGHLGKLDFRFKAGSGLGYLTKKFDPYTNRRNQAIGSHINGSMQLFFLLEHVGKAYAVNGGIGITHFSNGSFRVPNLGVNMPSLHIGISTVPEKEQVPSLAPLEPVKWQFSAAYAFKERTLTKPHGFNIFNVNAVRQFKRGVVTDWRLGGDVFLDKTHHYLDYPGEPLTGLKPWEMTEVGVFGGFQWLIARIHFKTDIGFYAYKPSKNKFFTYQRLGFDYHFHQNWYATMNLKTHFGIADHMSWGIGYRIRK